ncbi:MAG: hypothetical protein HYU60_03320 [Magnetospirillum sp.]|nr:hypothetical protein [Magnetospirillum sp.]
MADHVFSSLVRPILIVAVAVSLSGCLPMMALMMGGHGATGSHDTSHGQDPAPGKE